MSVTSGGCNANKTLNLVKNEPESVAPAEGEGSMENAGNASAPITLTDREYSQAEIDDLRKAALSLNEGLAKIKRLAENLKADMAKL